MATTDKFPLGERTFETRVKFVKELFSHTFEPYQIMAHCITHKLDRSLLAYVTEVQNSAWQLENEDPIALLKRIDN